MQTPDQLSLKNESVIVRVDFNVPMKDGIITDDSRIRAALPTLNYLIEQNCKVILLSHLGRPQKNTDLADSIIKEQFSLQLVGEKLGKITNKVVHFSEQLIGEEPKEKVRAMKGGEFLLIENTRFDKGEKTGDRKLAEQWSQLGNFFINDAFGTAHRKHASNAVLAEFFDTDHKAAGFLMAKEIAMGSKVLQNPQAPFIAIIGGAKVSDKMSLIENMIDLADHILIGGGMSFTFIKAKGGNIGDSLVEENQMDLALSLLKKGEEMGTQIHLPEDTIAANSFQNNAKTRVVNTDEIPDEWMGLDIGPGARQHYSLLIQEAKTVVWNGPMGVFEMDNFAEGTLSVAEALAQASAKGAFSLVGGGDSAAAVYQSGLADQISHISTGGGAMLTLLEGNSLPGIIALEE